MLQVKLTLASGFWQKASCLNPYYSAAGGGRVKYSNYPQCGDIPPDCQALLTHQSGWPARAN